MVNDASPTAARRRWRWPPLLVALASWLVPGGGHLLLRRWRRASVYFLCVGSLAALGISLRGYVFQPPVRGFFDLLGLIADAGAGVFYFLPWLWNNGGPDVSRAAGDYGTRFFAAAGVLNLLFALDAHEIASRRRG
jgi:hypothetical protein